MGNGTRGRGISLSSVARSADSTGELITRRWVDGVVLGTTVARPRCCSSWAAFDSQHLGEGSPEISIAQLAIERKQEESQEGIIRANQT